MSTGEGAAGSGEISCVGLNFALHPWAGSRTRWRYAMKLGASRPVTDPGAIPSAAAGGLIELQTPGERPHVRDPMAFELGPNALIHFPANQGVVE
jgi:hypothetical protein